MKAMTLLADFNLEDERGRVPVPLDTDVSLHVGDSVLVEDREGNRCKAVVAEIASKGVEGKQTLVAFLVPKPGTWERPS
ncbi:MAG: hypothetical protein ABR575_12000 [Actinomycetota bacterium]